MFTSLYTDTYGDAPRTEVGRYGLDLKESLARFFETCEKVGYSLEELEWKTGDHSIRITLPFGERNSELLHELADVEDCRADAPMHYELVEGENVTEGEYVKTGRFYC